MRGGAARVTSEGEAMGMVRVRGGAVGVIRGENQIVKGEDSSDQNHTLQDTGSITAGQVILQGQVQTPLVDTVKPWSKQAMEALLPCVHTLCMV